MRRTRYGRNRRTKPFLQQRTRPGGGRRQRPSRGAGRASPAGRADPSSQSSGPASLPPPPLARRPSAVPVPAQGQPAVPAAHGRTRSHGSCPVASPASQVRAAPFSDAWGRGRGRARHRARRHRGSTAARQRRGQAPAAAARRRPPPFQEPCPIGSRGRARLLPSLTASRRTPPAFTSRRSARSLLPAAGTGELLGGGRSGGGCAELAAGTQCRSPSGRGRTAGRRLRSAPRRPLLLSSLPPPSARARTRSAAQAGRPRPRGGVRPPVSRGAARGARCGARPPQRCFTLGAKSGGAPRARG